MQFRSNFDLERLQFQGSNQQQVKQYTGVADAFTKILKQEGIYGFTRYIKQDLISYQ